MLPLSRTPASLGAPAGEISDLRNVLGSNYLLNSNMDFFQRGTAQSVTNNITTYVGDRWLAFYNQVGAVANVSRQAFTPGATVVPNEPRYFMRWQTTVAGSGTPNALQYQQRIESVRTLAGKTATITFWAKADTTRSITVWWEQRFGTGGSPSATVNAGGVSFSKTFNLTAAWQQFTWTFTLPSISGMTIGNNNDDNLDILVSIPPSTTCIIDLAQFMLNEGAIAMPWRYAGGSLAGELSLCQRYFEKSYDIDQAPGSATTLAVVMFAIANYGTSNGSYYGAQSFQTRKRATPNNISIYSAQTGALSRMYDLGFNTDRVAAADNSNQTGFSAHVALPNGIYTVATGFWTADAEL